MEQFRSPEKSDQWTNKYELQAYIDQRLFVIQQSVLGLKTQADKDIVFDQQIRVLLSEFSATPGRFRHSFRTKSGSLYYVLKDGGEVRFKSLDGKFVNYEGQQGQVSGGNIFVSHNEFERLREFRMQDENGKLLLLDRDIKVSDLRIGAHPIEFNYLKENDKAPVVIEEVGPGTVRFHRNSGTSSSQGSWHFGNPVSSIGW